MFLRACHRLLLEMAPHATFQRRKNMSYVDHSDLAGMTMHEDRCACQFPTSIMPLVKHKCLACVHNAQQLHNTAQVTR